MICRLCLSSSDKYFAFFDSEGLHINAATIVGKYFWFEPKPNDVLSNFICFNCWPIIKSFHELYVLVEDAHKNLANKVFFIKSDPTEEVFDNDNKTTQNENTLKENVENETTENKIFPDKTDTESEKDDKDWDNAELNNDVCDDMKSEKEDAESTLEKKTENEEPPKRKKRGRPPASSKKQTKKKKVIAEDNSEVEGDSSDDKPLNKPNKRTPEEMAAFNKRLAEEDQVIARFTKIFCTVCSVEQINFTSLKNHSAFIHKQKGFVVCCEKKYFKRSKLVDHIEKHLNPDKYKCHLCNKISMTRWTLKIHIDNVHKNVKNESHQCSFCGKSFKSKNVMLRHQLIHIPEDERQFKCSQCDKSYPSQGTLNHHIRAYHDKRYSGMCDICGKTYNNKQEVRRHRLEVHEGAEKTKYKCKYCDLLFTTKYLCNLHKFEQHEHQNQIIEHKCNICKKTMSNSEALKSHVQYAHKSKPKFQCNICEKVFKRELVLKEHMAAHTGQPLYACPHCPKTFTHSSNMHHHRKRVHPVEFEEARHIKDDKKESWCKITSLTK